MDSIGVRELRQHASRYLERVRRGESIEVTDRGTPVAILVPAATHDVRDRLVREGRLVPRRGARTLPEPVISSLSTGQVLDELRAERS
jgi:prevent-host-death family protein